MDDCAEKTVIYTVTLNEENQVESVLLEVENSFERWLYKRNPAGMELPLTDSIFEEAVKVFLDNGIGDVEVLYTVIRDTDEYYANLMKKVYKKYLKEYVFESNLHRDAFWD